MCYWNGGQKILCRSQESFKFWAMEDSPTEQSHKDNCLRSSPPRCFADWFCSLRPLKMFSVIFICKSVEEKGFCTVLRWLIAVYRAVWLLARIKKVVPCCGCSLCAFWWGLQGSREHKLEILCFQGDGSTSLNCYLKLGLKKALSKLYMDVFFGFTCVGLSVSIHCCFPCSVSCWGKPFQKRLQKAGPISAGLIMRSGCSSEGSNRTSFEPLKASI